MRLDAHRGDSNWNVYHAEWCCMLPYVVWVDDVINRWCELVQPFVFNGSGFAHREHQAKKIKIYPDRRLVIINPVEDSDEQYLQIKTEAVKTGNNVNSTEPAST